MSVMFVRNYSKKFVGMGPQSMVVQLVSIDAKILASKASYSEVVTKDYISKYELLLCL